MTVDAKYLYKIVRAENLGDPTADVLQAFPDSVQPEQILKFLIDIYGEPKESAVSENEDFGRIAIGWVFDDLPTTHPSGQSEVVLIPMIALPGEPEPVSMFVHQAQVRRDFLDRTSAAGLEAEFVSPRTDEDPP